MTTQTMVPKTDLDNLKQTMDNQIADLRRQLEAANGKATSLAEELEAARDEGSTPAAKAGLTKLQRELEQREAALKAREHALTVQAAAAEHGLERAEFEKTVAAIPEAERTDSRIVIEAKLLKATRAAEALKNGSGAETGSKPPPRGAAPGGGAGIKEYPDGAAGLDQRIKDAGGWDAWLSNKK